MNDFLKRLGLALLLSLAFHAVVFGSIVLLANHARPGPIARYDAPLIQILLEEPEPSEPAPDLAAITPKPRSIETPGVFSPAPPPSGPMAPALAPDVAPAAENRAIPPLPQPTPNPIPPAIVAAPAPESPAPCTTSSVHSAAIFAAAAKTAPLFPGPAKASPPPAPSSLASAASADPLSPSVAQYRRNPKPAYPASARRLGQEGLVVLTVEVDAAGRVSAVTLKRSSGFAALDAAAEKAVQRWEFVPARLDGRPVRSEVEVPLQFMLAKRTGSS